MTALSDLLAAYTAATLQLGAEGQSSGLPLRECQADLLFQIKAAIAEMHGVLVAFAAVDPAQGTDHREESCQLCGVEQPDWPDGIEHAPSCPWLRARAIVGEPVP